MTTAFAALLIGVAGAALLLAVAGYLWVNRTPRAEERFDRYGRVPLFGVDMGAAPRPLETADAPDEQEIRNARHAVSRSPLEAHEASTDARSDESNSDDVPLARSSTEVEPTSSQRSPFAPPTLHLHPSVTPSSNDAQTPHVVDESVINRTPARDSRPRRSGWGLTPGWPVAPENGPPSTPRYFPSVNADAPQARPAPTASSSGPRNGNAVSADGVPGSMIEGHQLRFSAPAAGTLQFLPGRLEISTGLDTGREIRFVRVPGPNGTEVTFGRNEGPLYRHIQLRDQTVSREHARLVFANAQWTLTNLSRTNPVAHNGRILGLAEEQLLSDGDRLEMGEVIFNFRSR